MKRKLIGIFSALLFTVSLVGFNFNTTINTAAGKPVVKCYCKYWWLADNQCTVNGDNELCATGSCAGSDDNCDWFGGDDYER